MRGKRPSVERVRAVTRYEEVRKQLLENSSDEYLDKPLAYWVLPADRRLPLAFLGRSLGDLLNSGIDELATTPGVGEKKIRSFLNLLTRIATSSGQEGNGSGRRKRQEPSARVRVSPDDGFDPNEVSEVVWSQWQETVRRCGLAYESVGRVAPSLRNITRVIWQTPLADYLGVPLAELRDKRTYGEKRVRSVLTVFFGIHQLLNGMSNHNGLAVRLVPRHVDHAERWVGHCLQRADLPDATEIRESFVVPLAEQLRQDASRQIVQLAEIRLGICGPVTSVRQTARRMGLTRARIYQLLNEINDILAVRWPLGRCQSYHLLERLEAESPGEASLDQFRAAVELFYPAARRGAAGPVEKATPTNAG